MTSPLIPTKTYAECRYQFSGGQSQTTSQRDVTVIVAMRRVRMVQVIADEVVDVIAVRNRVVPTRRTMLVRFVMPRARVVGRAPGGVRSAHSETVLVDMVSVGVVQVTLMQVIAVSVVLDGPMPAAFAVDVCMRRMDGVFHSFLSIDERRRGSSESHGLRRHTIVADRFESSVLWRSFCGLRTSPQALPGS